MGNGIETSPPARGSRYAESLTESDFGNVTARTGKPLSPIGDALHASLSPERRGPKTRQGEKRPGATARPEPG